MAARKTHSPRPARASIATKLYPLDEAVKLVKERAKAKFDETIEVAMNLGVDPRHADQMVRGVVNLPNGTGRTHARRGVRARRQGRRGQGRGRRRGRRGGPGREGQGGKIDFDRCIATPDLMPLVGRLGKVLGPARPDAEPEGRHRHHGRRPARSRAPRAARSSSASRRPASSRPASARPRSRPTSSPRTSRPSRTRCTRRSRRAPRATYINRVAISSTMGPGVKVEPSIAVRAG